MKKFTMSVLALAALSGASHANVSELWDRNAYVHIDTSNTDAPGMDGWEVDGVNHLFNQWFWFRVGDTGGEQPIHALPEIGRFVTDTNPFIDSRPDTFNVSFGSMTSYTIDVRFSLTGGVAGSNTSDILETITITNRGSTVLPFRFFQYADFDLNNDVVDQSVSVDPFNRVVQTDGTLGVAETVISPPPAAHEVGVFSSTLDSLNDASPTTLNGTSTLSGTDRQDYTWAFQWNANIAPGQSFIISKDKLLVPAPGAAALLTLGGLLAARRRR